MQSFQAWLHSLTPMDVGLITIAVVAVVVAITVIAITMQQHKRRAIRAATRYFSAIWSQWAQSPHGLQDWQRQIAGVMRDAWPGNRDAIAHEYAKMYHQKVPASVLAMYGD